MMDAMGALRSPRLAAVLLASAAVAGLIAANSPAAPAVFAARDLYLGPLSVGHWITDGLLAVFFFLAAVELRHEFTHGALDSPRRALVPAIAAVGGVIVPALVFLALVRDPALSGGWPIPTATDIAFALGLLAIVGRGLPGRVRVLLLALAVIDDLIAILFIAFFFTRGVNPVPLLVAVPLVLVFGWLGYRVKGRAAPAIVIGMIVIAAAVWTLVHLSGVHATIAGVALGLVLPPLAARPARHALEPVSNAVILPLFAFTAALVVIPSVGVAALGPVFWGIAIALPLGKLVGITGGALIASLLIPAAERRATLPIGEIIVVAALGGIGFTVSLLMNELAYRDAPGIATEGTLGVLVGSLAAVVIGAVLTGLRARAARRAPVARDS
jgi:NhaA family Na+:H+ antiporter